ncbi:MAG: tetratricopeptide repeat protein [Proteobacteria bacterium]|nr:tetratricopeptide repeat protein [Pseudomonadota bacterium]
MGDSDDRRLLERGLELHRSGRRAEAEEHYRRVLAQAPNHPDALHLLGLVAYEGGRADEALELIDRASAAEPMRAAYHKNAGLALLALGRVDASVARLRRAIRLRSDDAEAHNHLGTALVQLGKPADAFASYQEALRLAPGYAAAALNLGNVLAEDGRWEEALSCYLRARSLESSPQFRQAVTVAIQAAAFDAAEGIASKPELLELVLRALAERWARPAFLSRGIVRLLKTRPAVRGAIERANAAWPRRPALAERFGNDGLGALMREPLLVALMERAPVADGILERILTAVRRELLDEALAAANADRRTRAATDRSSGPAADATAGPVADADASIAFRCALARQCFLNGYVFDATDEELAHAAGLGDAIGARLRDGAPVLPEWLAAAGAYAPLGELADTLRLQGLAWPGPVAALIRQQVTEPRHEDELRATLPRLTPIDPASAAVRAQYEDHPYPRWTSVAHVAVDANSGRRIDGGRGEMLVAGCGTGQESIEVALAYPSADVLAVDLSLASLAFAERMAREMGVANVVHAQADILHLATLGRSFDVIYSVGVLHHLADPAAGLQVLASLLRPDGAMLLGLYSERARSDIVAARAHITESGFQPTTAGIRRCRQDLMARDPSSPLGRVALLRDFHAASECRDLLFHVEEHRYTWRQVQDLAEGAGLRVTAVAAPAAARRAYAARFPGDPAMIDLARWDAIELEHPDTFAGMYLFHVERAT